MSALELNQIISKVLPVILTFVLGFFLKKRGIFTSDNAETFLKLVFFISLPALIFVSIVRAKLSSDLIFIPITCMIVVLITLPIVYSVGRRFHLPGPSLGAFVVGPMITNTTFVVPFLLTTFGREAIALLSIFDIGNNIMIYTLVYYCANRHRAAKNSESALKIIARSPLLYALFTGLILNAMEQTLPPVFLNFFQGLGDMTTPLVMLSLGIYFKPTLVRTGATVASITIRIIIGFLIALFFTFLFGIDGLNRTVVLVACSAPLGFTTLTFSAIAGLDTEFAASCVSYSILIGLFTTPLLILFLL
jgi:malate permease and related proteins